MRVQGAALRFASPKLQADLEVVIEALKQDTAVSTAVTTNASIALRRELLYTVYTLSFARVRSRGCV